MSFVTKTGELASSAWNGITHGTRQVGTFLGKQWTYAKPYIAIGASTTAAFLTSGTGVAVISLCVAGVFLYLSRSGVAKKTISNNEERYDAEVRKNPTWMRTWGCPIAACIACLAAGYFFSFGSAAVITRDNIVGLIPSAVRNLV